MEAGALIQAIVNAIIRQEGEPETALNPTNLRWAPWLPTKSVVIKDGFWVPSSRADGIAGAFHVVALHVAMHNTLTELISLWAPASDGNDTTAYIADVQRWAGIVDANIPLYTLITEP